MCGGFATGCFGVGAKRKGQRAKGKEQRAKSKEPMEEIRRKRAIAIGLRAQLPLITRIVALFVLIAGVVYFGWKKRSRAFST